MSAEARPTGAETERDVVTIVSGEWDESCDHDWTWTGMEGTARTLPTDPATDRPRWPLLLKCDQCGTLGVRTSEGPIPVRARLRSTETPTEGEAEILPETWVVAIPEIIDAACRLSKRGGHAQAAVFSILARLRSETPMRGELGYVVVDIDDTAARFVHAFVLPRHEAENMLAFCRSDRNYNPHGHAYRLHPVGPALSPVEPEEGV